MAHENRISGPCPAEMMHRILMYESFLAQMGYIWVRLSDHSQVGCDRPCLVGMEHKERWRWVGLIMEPTSCGVDTGHAGC